MNKPEIDIIEFVQLTDKLDIRYGTIVKVEDIAKSDKMYKLTVDFGTETRTILSAIKKHIHSDQLVEAKFPFILNMPPRKMLGEVSQGMIILPSSVDEEPYFFPEMIPNGTPLFGEN